MAEVPEVETLVRDLRKAVVGRTLVEAEVLQPAVVRFPTVDEFIDSIAKHVVLEAQRRADLTLVATAGVSTADNSPAAPGPKPLSGDGASTGRFGDRLFAGQSPGRCLGGPGRGG